MHARRRGFRAQQICGPDLNGGGAKRERRDHPEGIGDAAGGNDRDTHRPDDLWHEREESDLGCHVIRQKHSAMTTGFNALRDDRVDAVRLEPARLVHRRGR